MEVQLSQSAYHPLRKRWGYKLTCATCGWRTLAGGIPTRRKLRALLAENKIAHVCKGRKTWIQKTSHHAAEINHTFVEQTTAQTRTGATTYADISGAAIASGNFTTGKKYRLRFTAFINTSTTNVDDFQIKALHGSTDFDGSEYIAEPVLSTSYYCYTWSTVWTAIASEGVKLQFAVSNGAQTVSADHITLKAMNLTDDLTEDTDWHFSENTTDTTLTTSWSTTNNPVITFTPGTAGQDWLVETTALINTGAATIQFETRIDRSGEATSVLPSVSQEGEALGTELFVQTPFRVFNLGAAENVFTGQSRTDGATGTNTREYGNIFALNLNKFRNHANIYTEGTVALSTTDFLTEVQTDTIQPDVTGDVWILGQWMHNSDLGQEFCKGRMQVDQADQPPGQTASAYIMADTWDATDKLPIQHQTVENLDATVHTIDLDASGETTLATAEFRQIMAVTMELAAAAPAPEVVDFTDGISI